MSKPSPSNRLRRLRYGSVSLLLIVSLLAVLIGINLLTTHLETAQGWRVDYSFNAVTTQSDTTLQVLRQLAHPVHLYALFNRGQEDAPLIELLNRYAAASPLVTWEHADLSLNPSLLQQFHNPATGEAVKNDSLIVSCEATGHYRILSPADFVSLSLNTDKGVYEVAGLKYEQQITSALLAVTQAKVPRVRIAQSEGELLEADLNIWTALLRRNAYDVDFVNLEDQSLTLDPTDTLALLSPTKDISDAALKRISEFCEQGGSLLITCDYTDPLDRMPNVGALLRSYGFLPKNGIVVASKDEPGSYYDKVRIDLLPTMLATEATAPLLSAGTTTLLMTGSRAFATPTEADRNLETEVMLQSGEQAYLRDFSGTSMSLDRQPGDEEGPFALALNARRVTTAGEISRAAVLGCSTLLTNSQLQSMTDTEVFLLTLMRHLNANAAVSPDIAVKAAVRPSLSPVSITPGLLLTFALPVLVLAAALIVLLPRRRL